MLVLPLFLSLLVALLRPFLIALKRSSGVRDRGRATVELNCLREVWAEGTLRCQIVNGFFVGFEVVAQTGIVSKSLDVVRKTRLRRLRLHR